MEIAGECRKWSKNASAERKSSLCRVLRNLGAHRERDIE